jgi:hypothetical protein
MSLKFKLPKFNRPAFLRNFGKREGLVYIIILFWIGLGILGAFKKADFTQLAVYFGSLTAYVATYIWAESKRPSSKSGIVLPGPSSRREIMIYVVVVLWAIAGVLGILNSINLSDLSIYFVSLTGFVASWIAGEVYKPQDEIKIDNTNG